MIDELHVENLALIKDATFMPSSGMTAITGETGAGKTALLSACRLIMGQRSDKDMVRYGCENAEVNARLFDSDNNEIVVNRSVSADGKSRVKINGKMTSVGELAEIVGVSISLCSQHDQVLLAKPSMHRIYFDSWAQICQSQEFVDYQSAYQDEIEARERLEKLREASSVSEAKLEEARFILKQIEAVSPSEEDYNELLSAVKKAENAELLARASQESRAALSGEQGALDLLNASIAFLENAQHADETLGDYAATLREALYSVEDVAREVSRYAEAFEFDTASIEMMQERISAYQSLIRTYGPDLNSVLVAEVNARAVVEAQDGSNTALKQAEENHATAISTLNKAARALHKLRAKEAPRFASAINKVLKQLSMPEASVTCEVAMQENINWNAEGPDNVEFLFSPAEGMQMRPLSKIASGGELSRVMLALHAVMGTKDDISTLVFDEVDVGIGGNAAADMATLMHNLAQTHQLIVVTHSAQIAAVADKHYIAQKQGKGENLETVLCAADNREREKEIARMLSGALTEVSMQHARELLAGKTCMD